MANHPYHLYYELLICITSDLEGVSDQTIALVTTAPSPKKVSHAVIEGEWGTGELYVKKGGWGKSACSA